MLIKDYCSIQISPSPFLFGKKFNKRKSFKKLKKYWMNKEFEDEKKGNKIFFFKTIWSV